MSPSFRTARWVGLASVFVFVAAVAFGAKLWHKTPKDFFLSLATDSDTAQPTLPEVAHEAAGGSGSLARLGGVGGAAQHVEGSPRGSANEQGERVGIVARQEGNAQAWTPWGSRSLRRGMNGSSASSGSAALGGLWHSMSPFGGHGGGTTADTPATAHADTKPAAVKAAPTPASKPAPRSSPSPSSPHMPAPPASAPPATAGSAVPSPSAAPPAGGGGLGEHETPLPEVGPGPVGGGPGPVGGSPGPGGRPGPVGSPAPSEPSANPEPGTLALVGTGLLGLVRLFRRRQV